MSTMEKNTLRMMCCLLLLGDIYAFPLSRDFNPTAVSQWEGGCDNDCHEDPQMFCDGERKWCHNCAIFCAKDGDGEYADKGKCRTICPALYEKLNSEPSVTTAIPPNESTTLMPTTNQETDYGISTVSKAADETMSISKELISPYPVIPAISNQSTRNWIDQNYARWLLGGLFFLLLCIITAAVVIKKTICRPKAPTQCSEGHQRAPLFYAGPSSQHGTPRPAAAQQPTDIPPGSNIPLLPHNQQDPDSLPSHARTSNQVEPCSSQISSSNNNRILASGADASFVPGDQSGHSELKTTELEV